MKFNISMIIKIKYHQQKNRIKNKPSYLSQCSYKNDKVLFEVVMSC